MPLETSLLKPVWILISISICFCSVSLIALAALVASNCWLTLKCQLINFLEKFGDLSLAEAVAISSLFVVLGITFAVVFAQTKRLQELKSQVKARREQIRYLNQQLLREVLERSREKLDRNRELDEILRRRLLKYSGQSPSSDRPKFLTEDQKVEEANAPIVNKNLQVTRLSLAGTVENIAEHPELKALLAAIADSIWVLNRYGRYMQVLSSDGTQRDSNLQEFLGKNLYEVFEQSQADFLLANLLHALDCQQTVKFEYNLPNVSTPNWFVASILPLSANLALWVARDITKQKQAEDKIRALNLELEKRVAERTRELRAANQELEAFCYSISHDLRAPLRRIDSFSGILLADYQEVLDANGQYYLQRVCQSTEHMRQKIDDLLALSRLTLSEMHFEVVDLSAIANQIVAELQAGDRCGQVTFAIAEDVTACGDARFLKIVLENLLGNAWKYTSKRSQASIEFGFALGNRSIYFVRDNGAGFDMAYASKLFSPFQRLHSTAEFEGHGIGLAIVQRIIRRHSGTVWAEAAVDRGATFYFTLPNIKLS